MHAQLKASKQPALASGPSNGKQGSARTGRNLVPVVVVHILMVQVVPSLLSVSRVLLRWGPLIPGVPGDTAITVQERSQR